MSELTPLFIAIFSIYFGWYRNGLVWAYRNKVMDTLGLHEFFVLPGYYEMVFRPFKWSDRKLKRFIKSKN